MAKEDIAVSDIHETIGGLATYTMRDVTLRARLGAARAAPATSAHVSNIYSRGFCRLIFCMLTVESHCVAWKMSLQLVLGQVNKVTGNVLKLQHLLWT